MGHDSGDGANTCLSTPSKGGGESALAMNQLRWSMYLERKMHHKESNPSH